MSQNKTVSFAPQRHGLRFWPFWFCGALIVLALLLGGVRIVLIDKLAAHAQSFVDAEARHGRNWACNAGSSAGFPLRLSYQCEVAHIKGADGLDVTLAHATADWSVLAPTHVFVSATSPARILAGEGVALGIDWTTLQLVVAGISPGSVRGQLEGQQVHFVRSDEASVTHSAEYIHLEAGPLAEIAEKSALPVAVRATGIKSPVLAQALRNEAPLDIDFSGDILRPEAFKGGFSSENIELWRQLSGIIHVQHLRLTAADLNISADGTVALDDQHRIAGVLNVNIRGGEALLSQYGYNTKKGLLGSMLGGVLKGSGLSLPLRLSDGRVWLGPIKLPVQLIALY
eukprot:gene7394-7461_t